jgi:peroxiredoxin
VLALVWATWCPPCVKSIPHLNDIYARFRGRVQIVGVTDEVESKVTPFAEKHNMTYTVACDTDKEANELLFQESGSRGIPTGFVVDTSGIIRYFGHPMEPAFERAIEAVVEEADKKRRAAATSFTSASELESKSVKELKTILRDSGKSSEGCIEKSDLIARILEK